MPQFRDLCGTHVPGESLMQRATLAMKLAEEVAQRVRGTTSPNPPVGAVVVSAEGKIVGAAATEPVGGLHAEPQALAMADSQAKGGLLVVTLEPCHHQGRTPPCTGAVASSGVAAVAFAVSDPNPVAAGGATWLEQQHLTVLPGVGTDMVSEGSLAAWLHWQRTGKPRITVKTATTLNGFIAATDGSSQWITGARARQFVHEDRQLRDAIVVGTGTVLKDNPRLTARKPKGALFERQPTRVVIGTREIPSEYAITQPIARAAEGSSSERENFLQLATHDVEQWITELGNRGFVDVLVEGGATLIASLFEADAIDMIDAYIAPAMLSNGIKAIEPAPNSSLATTSMAEIRRFQTRDVITLSDDILLRLVK